MNWLRNSTKILLKIKNQLMSSAASRLKSRSRQPKRKRTVNLRLGRSRHRAMRLHGNVPSQKSQKEVMPKRTLSAKKSLNYPRVKMLRARQSSLFRRVVIRG